LVTKITTKILEFAQLKKYFTLAETFLKELMFKPLLIILVMSTFLMNGCTNESKSIAYFEACFGPVQELIDLDTQFQTVFENQLVTEEDLEDLQPDSIPESHDSLWVAFDRVKKFVQQHGLSSLDIEVYNDEHQLKQAYIRLLVDFDEELQTTYPQLFDILLRSEADDEEIERFNSLLKANQAKLDASLDRFYQIAEEYAIKYDIELTE
jgi:hypothetical protein